MEQAERRPEAAVEVRITAPCPAPVLGVARALRTMTSGEVLLARCLDKASKADIAAFARQTGNALLAQEEVSEAEEVWFLHWLRKR